MKLVYKFLFAVCAGVVAFGATGNDAFAQKEQDPSMYKSDLKAYKGRLPERADQGISHFVDVCMKGRRVRKDDIKIYSVSLNGDRSKDYIADFSAARGPVADDCWDVPCDDQGCYITIYTSISPTTYKSSYNARVSYYNVFTDAAELFEGTNKKTRILEVHEHTSACLPADLNADGKCQRFYKFEDRSFTQVFLKK